MRRWAAGHLNFLLRGGRVWDSVSVGGACFTHGRCGGVAGCVWCFFSNHPTQAEGDAHHARGPEDQSCKWYSDTCRAVLAESATERSGDESFLEEFATKKDSGLRSLFGADRALCGVADGHLGDLGGCSAKERCSFCPIHESESLTAVSHRKLYCLGRSKSGSFVRSVFYATERGVASKSCYLSSFVSWML